MIFPDLLTPRLRLVAVREELMQAETFDRSRFSVLLGAEVPPLWPPKDWEPHVFDVIRKQHQEYPSTEAWHRYAVLRVAKPVLIGAIGAFPRSGSEAEMGYSILEPWQRAGLATEGSRAVIAEIFSNPAIDSIVAHTFPELLPSIRVIQKCGFRSDGAGEEERTLRFRLRRPSCPASGTPG